MAASLPVAVTVVSSVAVFMVAFFVVRIVPAATRAMATAKGAVSTMRDPELGEDEKERAVQAASLRLFASFGSILLRSAFALIAAAIPVLAADAAGFAAETAVTGFLSRWEVIAALTVLITLGWLMAVRLWPSR